MTRYADAGTPPLLCYDFAVNVIYISNFGFLAATRHKRRIDFRPLRYIYAENSKPFRPETGKFSENKMKQTQKLNITPKHRNLRISHSGNTLFQTATEAEKEVEKSVQN